MYKVKSEVMSIREKKIALRERVKGIISKIKEVNELYEDVAKRNKKRLTKIEKELKKLKEEKVEILKENRIELEKKRKKVDELNKLKELERDKIRELNIVRKWNEEGDLIEKRCFSCDRWLSLEFYAKGSGKDGYSGKCNDCYRKTHNINKREVKRKYDEEGNIVEKRCFNCKEWLEIDEFSRSNDSEDGFVSECKECIRKRYGRERMNEIKFKKRKYRKEGIVDDRRDVIEKKCWSCNSYLGIENFYNYKSSLDGKSDICKDCFKMRYYRK